MIEETYLEYEDKEKLKVKRMDREIQILNKKRATLLSIKENLKTIKVSRNEKRHLKIIKEAKDLRDNTIINLRAPKKIPWTRK